MCVSIQCTHRWQNHFGWRKPPRSSAPTLMQCVGTTRRHSLKSWSITENERDVLVRRWMVLPSFLTSILIQIQQLTRSPSLMINEVLSCFLKLKNNTSSIYQRQSLSPWLTPILWSTSRGKKKHQWVNSHSVMLGRAVIALKLSMSTADCKDHRTVSKHATVKFCSRKEEKDGTGLLPQTYDKAELAGKRSHMTAFNWEKWKSEDYQSEKEWQSVTSLEFRRTPCTIFQKFQRLVRLQKATIHSPGQLNLGAGWLFLIPTSLSLWKVLSVLGTPQWFLVADAKLPCITVQPITKISKNEKKSHSTPPSHLWQANGKYLQKSVRTRQEPSPTWLVISPSFLHLSDFYPSHWWPLCGQTLLMDLSSNNLSLLLNKITLGTQPSEVMSSWLHQTAKPPWFYPDTLFSLAPILWEKVRSCSPFPLLLHSSVSHTFFTYCTNCPPPG